MASNYDHSPVEVNTPLEKRIFDVFTVYDNSGVNMIDGDDVGTVLRVLGCVPTDDDIRDFVKKTELADSPGEIHFSRFVPHLKTLLLERKMSPSSPEALLDAFNNFDPKGKGFIEKEEFLKFMSEFGDRMTVKETKSMMKSAVEDNKIQYEVYMNQLVYEPEDSIYKLAADEFAALMKSRESKNLKTFKMKPNK